MRLLFAKRLRFPDPVVDASKRNPSKARESSRQTKASLSADADADADADDSRSAAPVFAHSAALSAAARRGVAGFPGRLDRRLCLEWSVHAHPCFARLESPTEKKNARVFFIGAMNDKNRRVLRLNAHGV